MAARLKIVAEQQLVIWRSASVSKRITMKLSEPRIESHPNGGEAWACYPKLDGLISLEKAVYGYSSFHAIVNALDACRQLIRDEARGAKIYLVGSLWGDDLDPEKSVSLDELFGTDK